jgi:hypothetical protein
MFFQGVLYRKKWEKEGGGVEKHRHILLFFFLQPIQLVSCTLDVASPGKIPAGKTEIPFEFPLTPRPNRTLYETYHGVFVNIQYLLRCEMKRSFLAKDHLKVAEFIVEYKVSTNYICAYNTTF